MSKNSDKKAAEKKLKEALSAPVVADVLPVDDAPVNNILDQFINSDDDSDIEKKEEGESPAKNDESPAKDEESKVEVKPEVSKLKDVPKKYWKFQTV